MKYSIYKTAVIGAGAMGSGIAALLSAAGIQVLLLDIVPNGLSEEEKAKGITERDKVFRNKYAEAAKEKALKANVFFEKRHANLITTGNIEDDIALVKDCDWIIEVVLENLDVKKNLMQKLAQHIKPGTIISSNTSGVSIHKIVEDMDDNFKKHFLGTHFFNPPRYMKLFEMIPCQWTSPEVMNFMADMAEVKLGKGVVFAKDTPNFIANRIGAFATISAIKLMEKYNFTIEKTDLLTGTVIGRPKTATFRMSDMVGIDVFCNVANNVVNNTKDAEEIDRFTMPGFIKELVAEGHLGDKTGEGCYKKIKTPEGKAVLSWNRNTKEYETSKEVVVDSVNVALKSSNKFSTMAYGEEIENQFVWEVLKNVLLYSASKVPEITEDYQAIDNAMKLGFNWEKGPFEIWDTLGLEKSVEKMKAEGEAIPAWITEKISSSHVNFYSNHDYEGKYLSLNSKSNEVIKDNADSRLLNLGDDVLCLQIQSKGNVISEKVMDMMCEAMSTLEDNKYRGLVIGSEGKNFSAGANLNMIYEWSIAKDWEKLGREITRLQTVHMSFKHSKKPVIVAPYGMTLGGGAEITLHCHEAVASAETYIGLVEVGVGLLPGGGGNKELLIRAMHNAGEINKYQRNEVTKTVWETIAMGKVSTSGFEAVKSNFLQSTDKIMLNKDALIETAKARVLEISEYGFKSMPNELITVSGKAGYAYLMCYLDAMEKGRFVSEHDALLAKKIAFVLTGGNVLAGATVTEQYLLDLEKEAFISLCGEEKTLQRIEYMLKNGKPLRN